MLVLILAAGSPIRLPAQDAPTPTGAQAAQSDWSDLMRSMDQMDSAMNEVPRTGNPDVDFVRLMLPHHAAAIGMARTQLLYGKDPQMRRLAHEIVTDQQSEIELMQLWLKQHGTMSSEGTLPDAHK
jgi:uncharacterized protein (DUF305 family)